MDCNNWTSVAPKLRKFARPLRVTLPCAGIDGAGHALKAMGISFQGTNAYDLEEGYRAHLQKLMPGAELRLGKQEGDITMVPLEELERPVHAVFSGPPCPPWSSAGNRNGQLDERADVLVYVLRMVVALAAVGELQFAIIENVVGISQKEKGASESFLDKILRILEQSCPSFVWGFTKLSAPQYLLPQTRSRIFIRGLRKSLAEGSPLPPCLPPFGERKLHEFLLPGLPPVEESQLTSQQRENLRSVDKDLKKWVGEKKVEAGSLVVVPLDRSDHGVYNRSQQVDKSPTLTCSNRYLFVASTADLQEPDPSKRAFYRFLTENERMVLQGFPSNTLAEARPALRRKASGNAYPVPLMLAAAHGLLDVLSQKQEFLFKAAGPRDLESAAKKELLAFDRAMHSFRKQAQAARGKKPDKKAGKGKKATRPAGGRKSQAKGRSKPRKAKSKGRAREAKATKRPAAAPMARAVRKRKAEDPPQDPAPAYLPSSSDSS